MRVDSSFPSPRAPSACTAGYSSYSTSTDIIYIYIYVCISICKFICSSCMYMYIYTRVIYSFPSPRTPSACTAGYWFYSTSTNIIYICVYMHMYV